MKGVSFFVIARSKELFLLKLTSLYLMDNKY
jgi:hypothetical protein